MASKFLDYSPPVTTALKSGQPIVVIETGFFLRLPYPENLNALNQTQQAFWSRASVPCFTAVINGRLKAGLTDEDMEILCQNPRSCARIDIPGLVGGGETAGAGASAAMTIAKMAGIIPVMAPGLSDTLADLDGLESTQRLVFCGKVSPDREMIYSSRNVPVLRLEGAALADAYQALKDINLNVSAVVPCRDTLGDMAGTACAAALELKKNSSFT